MVYAGELGERKYREIDCEGQAGGPKVVGEIGATGEWMSLQKGVMSSSTGNMKERQVGIESQAAFLMTFQ